MTLRFKSTKSLVTSILGITFGLGLVVGWGIHTIAEVIFG